MIPSPIMSSRIVTRMQASVRREFLATAIRCCERLPDWGAVDTGPFRNASGAAGKSWRYRGIFRKGRRRGGGGAVRGLNVNYKSLRGHLRGEVPCLPPKQQ